MSAGRGGIEEHELAAFVDGRLSAERVAAVDAYLAANPEERVRLQEYADQQQQLRDAFARRPDEPIPAHLKVARDTAPGSTGDANGSWGLPRRRSCF